MLFEAAVSLVGNPRLENPEDPTRQQLLKAAQAVADKDPEFILKVLTNYYSILFQILFLFFLSTYAVEIVSRFRVAILNYT